MDFILCAESLNKITFSLKIRIFFFFSFFCLKTCVGSLGICTFGQRLGRLFPRFLSFNFLRNMSFQYLAVAESGCLVQQ